MKCHLFFFFFKTYFKENSHSCERSWQLQKVPENWKKANVISIFKKGKKVDTDNHEPVSSPWIPKKVMEQLILVTISRTMKEMMIIGSS